MPIHCEASSTSLSDSDQNAENWFYGKPIAPSVEKIFTKPSGNIDLLLSPLYFVGTIFKFIGPISDLAENLFFTLTASKTSILKNYRIFLIFILFDIAYKVVGSLNLDLTVRLTTISLFQTAQFLIFSFFSGFTTTALIFYGLLLLFQIIGLIFSKFNVEGSCNVLKMGANFHTALMIIVFSDIIGFIYSFASSTSPFRGSFGYLLTTFIWANNFALAEVDTSKNWGFMNLSYGELADKVKVIYASLSQLYLLAFFVVCLIYGATYYTQNNLSPFDYGLCIYSMVTGSCAISFGVCTISVSFILKHSVFVGPEKQNSTCRV